MNTIWIYLILDKEGRLLAQSANFYASEARAKEMLDRDTQPAVSGSLLNHFPGWKGKVESFLPELQSGA